jgi:hypothetical protein
MNTMKRAQAAMEYLMTYGWALLVIVLVLGALIYLGVLNPQGRMQDMCNLPIGFGCEVVGLNGTNGLLYIKITNQQATQLNELKLSCKTTEGGYGNIISAGKVDVLNPGRDEVLQCNLGIEDRNIGDFVNGDIQISYETPGASGVPPKTIRGTYSAKVSVE